MDADDPFDAWKQDRRRPEPPAGFADRVLAALPEQPRRLPGPRLLRLIASRSAQVAVCTLAGLLCLFRMVSFLALFLPG